MLVLDSCQVSSLPEILEAADMDEDERTELARHAFAVLAAMLEDLAAEAVEGQGRHPSPSHAYLAATISSGVEQVAILAETISALFSQPDQ